MRAGGAIRPSTALGLVLLLLASVAAIAQSLAPIPPLRSPVVDITGTLDPASRRELEAQAVALQQRSGAQLQVLMVPSTGPEDIAQYSVRAFEQYRLGREDVDDGILLVVAKDDRRVRIETGYGLEGAIPDATAARLIQEYIVPRFRTGDYAGGLREATAVLARLVEGEALPPPMARQEVDEPGRGGGNVLLGLFAAFVAARFARAAFGGLPRLPRGMLTAGAAGGVGWLLSSLPAIGLVGAVLGFVVGLAGRGGGRFARHAGYGGFGMPGGFGGRGGVRIGGGFGGGWRGGGGMSGGGGASGSW